jgi:hypothetical protein
MDSCRSYAFRGTLVYGDIYGQILVWLLVVFLSLAAGLALMGASQPLVGIVAIDLVFVLLLPFLMSLRKSWLNSRAFPPESSPPIVRADVSIIQGLGTSDLKDFAFVWTLGDLFLRTPLDNPLLMQPPSLA